MELQTDTHSLPVFQALASQTRLNIINLLATHHKMNLTELAETLELSNPMITKHIKKLKEANLIKITKKPGISGVQKIVSLNIEEIHITLPQRIFPDLQLHSSSVGIGLYSDYHVAPTCGLVGPDGKIGHFDQPKYFSDNNRFQASLLWFSEGFVEYAIPNPLRLNEQPELLEFSVELSSEFIFSNNHWPSDITVAINDTEIGTYTVEGNFSDVRGQLTPTWWDDNLSQYGLLKHFRINKIDSGVDGEKLSNVTINDLKLNDLSIIRLKFSVKEDAINKGGLTIFGEHFGNHPQNIVMNLYYSK